jgi:lipopolysaccharide export system protein LptA
MCRKPLLFSTTIFTAVMFLAATATAADSARQQPISIYAEQLSIDENSGVSHYRGQVELQQGDLKFSGDELQLTQQDGSVTLMQASGKPAHFERSEPKPLRAEASHIDYDNQKGEVTLRGNAQLWQDSDQFSGELIHYNIDSRHVRAEGGAGRENGRVHVLIRPKDEGEQQ